MNKMVNDMVRLRYEVNHLEECLGIRVVPKNKHSARFLAGTITFREREKINRFRK
jgi:hypothetical protein